MSSAGSQSLFSALQRLASDLVTGEELVQRLQAATESGNPLRVKYGIDPTFPEVHLGHAVPLRVLRLFQDHGHLPVLILGDATARLGDPTGRNEQRPPLTTEEVENNAATYLDQIGRIVDLSSDRCEVRRNSEWFAGMDFFGALQLAAQGTVARLLERDDFRQRMDQRQAVHLHEMMYPLMQGWDSVAVQADVEIGGNDQLFNLHMGRLLQERNSQTAQVCLTTPLLLGTDGSKMSKSLGNHVPLAGNPNDAFGKIMSLSDEAMPAWFALLTPLSESELQDLLAGHPRDAKVGLARSIVAWLHGDEAAAAAILEFDQRFREGGLPTDIPELRLTGDSLPLAQLLKAAKLANSTSDARRLLEQGGVRVDGVVLKDPNALVEIGEDGILCQVGKRRVARIFLDPA